jgi:hypothetical protein
MEGPHYAASELGHHLNSGIVLIHPVCSNVLSKWTSYQDTICFISQKSLAPAYINNSQTPLWDTDLQTNVITIFSTSKNGRALQVDLLEL